MAAKNGKPVRLAENLKAPGAAAFEIHEPESGALLAVCPDCALEFDADHTTVDGDLADDGMTVTNERVGYECPRCVRDAALEVMQAQEARLKEATGALLELETARKELDHLRPQNKLLRDESLALRKAAKACELHILNIRQLGNSELLGLLRDALGDEAEKT